MEYVFGDHFRLKIIRELLFNVNKSNVEIIVLTRGICKWVVDAMRHVHLLDNISAVVDTSGILRHKDTGFEEVSNINTFNSKEIGKGVFCKNLNDNVLMVDDNVEHIPEGANVEVIALPQEGEGITDLVACNIMRILQEKNIHFLVIDFDHTITQKHMYKVGAGWPTYLENFVKYLSNHNH